MLFFIFQYQPSKLKVKRNADFNTKFQFVSSVEEYNKVGTYAINMVTQHLFANNPVISVLKYVLYCRIHGTTFTSMSDVTLKEPLMRR